MSGHRRDCPAWVGDVCKCAELSGYAFCCPVVGMYPCRHPECKCVEIWNAERDAEVNMPERELVAQARAYLADNAAESGADVLIAELADTLENRLPPIRQLAVK